MKIITDTNCATYSHPGHPERPQRITATQTKLKADSTLKLAWAEPAEAPDAAILRAHTQEHLQGLVANEDFDMDTPAYPGLPQYARRSVGAALGALESARRGVAAFSLMRPPGHHATRNRAMGFCYLNNIAIAVLEALATGAKRVAVFDFDVHHGNGTEAILLNKPGVSFYSVHQFPCYPGTGTRNVGENCYNFPVAPQTPRLELRHVLESALEHLAATKPEIIAVSAGFDAFERDPLAQLTLQQEDFLWVGQSLRKLGIPTFSVLEGGYSEELPDLVLAYLSGLAG